MKSVERISTFNFNLLARNCDTSSFTSLENLAIYQQLGTPLYCPTYNLPPPFKTIPSKAFQF
jgi:hypothetical protein